MFTVKLAILSVSKMWGPMYEYGYLSRSGASVVVDSAEVELLAVSGHARLHRARGHVAARCELPREHRRHQHLESGNN